MKNQGHYSPNKAATQQNLITRLNPVIRGCITFHRFNVYIRIFVYVDVQIFYSLWRRARRRHHNKGSRRIIRKYFHRIDTRNWTFVQRWKRDDGTTGYFALEYASDTKIVRFPGIRDGVKPHDEQWHLYLEERETEKKRITVKGNHTLRYLFNKQHCCCALCGEELTLETGGHCYKYKHGNASLNYLVHPDCHQKLQQFPSFQPVYCCRNKQAERLEPYDGKLSCAVLRGRANSNVHHLPDYASAECFACGLNPMTTNLVVAE